MFNLILLIKPFGVQGVQPPAAYMKTILDNLTFHLKFRHPSFVRLLGR